MKAAIIKISPLGFPWETQDPFLFCAYHLDRYPEGNEALGPEASLEGRNLGNDFIAKDGWRMYHGHTVPGFPYHPHRGFETITIVNQGYCDHSDSLGAAGRFGEGDVQWMTAGRGVQHSEMFPLLHRDKENPLELFQIWLNLPKSAKFSDPYFKMIWHEEVPVVELDGAKIKLISGNFRDIPGPAPAPDSWAANTDNEIAIWNIHLEPKASLALPPALGKVNRSLFYYSGDEAFIEGTKVRSGHVVNLNAGNETKLVNSGKSSHFLLLQGKPISEPVAKYGPFVMNSEAEIRQAMDEYRLTQFGGWPWPHADMVHPRGKGRFALYPDGSVVEKQLS